LLSGRILAAIDALAELLGFAPRSGCGPGRVFADRVTSLSAVDPIVDEERADASRVLLSSREDANTKAAGLQIIVPSRDGTPGGRRDGFDQTVGEFFRHDRPHVSDSSARMMSFALRNHARVCGLLQTLSLEFMGFFTAFAGFSSVSMP